MNEELAYIFKLIPYEGTSTKVKHKKLKLIEKLTKPLEANCRIWTVNTLSKRLTKMDKNTFIQTLHELRFADNELVLPDNTIYIVALNRKRAHQAFLNLVNGITEQPQTD